MLLITSNRDNESFSLNIRKLCKDYLPYLGDDSSVYKQHKGGIWIYGEQMIIYDYD